MTNAKDLVVVTGGNGFIGRSLTSRLVDSYTAFEHGERLAACFTGGELRSVS